MKYTVVYLKHSLFNDAERVTSTMTQSELVHLLQNGTFSLLSAEAVSV